MVDPKKFENKMKIVVMENPEDESTIKADNYDSADATQGQ